MALIDQRRLIARPPTFWASKLLDINWPYVLLLCALAGVGYAALYSAGLGPDRYANRHATRFAVGLVMMIGVAVTDLRRLRQLAWPLYGAALFLLLLVARFGHVGKGAQRWLDIGPLQIQPSELMKVALVLALAAWFSRADWDRAGRIPFLIPPTLAVLLPVALILKEPNLGTAVITLILGAAVFVAAGVRLWWFALGAIAVAAAAPLAYRHLHDYQRARILTFLHPERDPLGAGYNILQSRIALGSGGLWGEGFMHGTQGVLAYLPERQTDFIFTMWAEQFGFVGGAALLLLLLAVIGGAILTALRCRSQFGRLLALGVGVNFSLYVFVNIAMVTGAIPVGGVPLPLVSHGGSALLTVMFGFGLLMSVHVHRDDPLDETPAD
jgi:rod shape determining protein RodA